ncbi:MAG TPA: hypothetical protein VGK49_06865 [Ilumatobacteraceae bacterium]
MTDYITSANFKTRHGITVTTHDTRIAAHVTAASLEVDSMCGRQFGPGASATRYFHPYSCYGVRVDDCHTITAVALDLDDSGSYATTLDATDYVTLPTNGIGPNGQSGWPVTEIRLVSSRYQLPQFVRPSVKVTATYGWASTPVDVVEATYLLAHRLFYEVAVPSGVTAPNLDIGLPGSPLQRPYTVERLLQPYVRSEKKIGVAG